VDPTQQYKRELPTDAGSCVHNRIRKPGPFHSFFGTMSNDSEELTPDAGLSTNKPVKGVGSSEYKSVSSFFGGKSSTVQLRKGKEAKKLGRSRDPKFVVQLCKVK
jgi:hypothetical protein